MNKLTIFENGGKLYTDSREVARMIGKRHADLLESISNYGSILTNGNFRSLDFFVPQTYTDAKGETRPCYDCTKKGCDMIANKLTGQKGVLFTAAYVSAFEQMLEQLTVERFNLPRTYSDAMRLAADFAEQIEADKPKVLFAEAVEAAHTSILVGELAKLLKQNGCDVGQNRLFRRLREDGYLIRRRGTDYNMPTQKSVGLGLFEIKESTITNRNGCVQITKTPKVTGKGQRYFINKYLATHHMASC